MSTAKKRKTGSFNRSRHLSKYYSHGSYAAKIEDKRDEVSLKYYGRQIKKEEKANRLMSIKKIVTALIITVCCFATVLAKSQAANYKIENNRLKSVLEEQRYKTESLVMANKQNIDIAYVEEVAKTKLNMAKPQMYQKIEIEVPKSDYVVVNNLETYEVEEQSILTEILNFFSEDTLR